MTAWIFRALLVIGALELTMCSSIDVKTDHDAGADFSQFKTFAFGGLGERNRGSEFDNSLTRKRIESAVSRELTKKGLRRVEEGQPSDLLVHYWVTSKDKQNVQGTGPPVGYYGARGGYRGGYYGAGYSGVTTFHYREGTLILDLIEPTKHQLVWRATMVAPLESSAQDNVELGNKAIEEAFEHYPPKNDAS